MYVEVGETVSVQKLDGLEELHGLLSWPPTPYIEVEWNHVVHCLDLQIEDLANGEACQIARILKNFVEQVRLREQAVNDIAEAIGVDLVPELDHVISWMEAEPFKVIFQVNDANIVVEELKLQPVELGNTLFVINWADVYVDDFKVILED